MKPHCGDIVGTQNGRRCLRACLTRPTHYPTARPHCTHLPTLITPIGELPWNSVGQMQWQCWRIIHAWC